MTINDIQRATIVAAPPSSPPRLHLAPVRAGRAVLDGGWWPRSWDPVAELPALILDLDASFGPIRQVLLNIDAWDRRFRRLAVGPRVVRMGWFTSLDPALLIATTERGDQIDLLIVPPGTARATARAAMARAADPADTTRAPAILATMPAAPDGPAGRRHPGIGVGQRGRPPRRGSHIPTRRRTVRRPFALRSSLS